MLGMIDKLAGAWLRFRTLRGMRKFGQAQKQELDAQLGGLNIRFDPADGKYSLSAFYNHPELAVLAEEAKLLLDEIPDAENYVEFTLYPRADVGGSPVIVTVQRYEKMTPATKASILERCFLNAAEHDPHVVNFMPHWLKLKQG